MANTVKRNGKIELLRFLFTLAVLGLHIGMDITVDDTLLKEIPLLSAGVFNFTFFKWGNMGVEFFFIVSGFLMAKSIYKKVSVENKYNGKLGTETASFVWRKAKAVLPYILFFSLAMIVILFICTKDFGFNALIEKIGSMFFLQRTGVSSRSLIGVDWYISTMLIVMFLLYPLCRRFYNVFTHIIAPIGGLLLLGYLIQTTNDLGGSEAWSYITFKTNLRGLAEIAIGTTCFEISRALTARKFSGFVKLIFSVMEILCYGMVFLYIMSDMPGRFTGYVAVLLAIGVTLSFSGQTLLGNAKFFHNRFFCFLGAVSLPIYLCQQVYRELIPYLVGGNTILKVILIFSCSVGTGILAYIIWTAIRKAWLRSRQSKAPKHTA